jgi:hypothetical protein
MPLNSGYLPGTFTGYLYWNDYHIVLSLNMPTLFYLSLDILKSINTKKFKLEGYLMTVVNNE